MKKPPHIEIEADRTIRLLSVSPFSQDHRRLNQILGRSLTGFEFNQSHTLAAAASLLRRRQIAVVVCEYNLLPDSWTDLFAVIRRQLFPLSMIVTTRLADENKWAEILNLGAYDLLAKPFDDHEVRRVVTAAWHHWSHERADHSIAPQLCLSANGD